MAIRYYKNGPARALAFPIALASDTSMTLDSVAGFPTQFPYTLIIEPDTALEEVVDVTAAVGNVLTITRGVDGTTASAHATASVVYHGISARDPREANEHVNATTNIHGRTGSLVDTDTAQSITGTKTFTTLATVAGGNVVAVGGAQTITGNKTFSGTTTMSGSTLLDNVDDTSDLPRGIVAYAESSADSVLSAGANSRVAVLGVGYTMVAGRKYRIRTQVELVPTSAGFNRLHIHNLTTGDDWAFHQAGVVKSASVADTNACETIYNAATSGARTFQAQALSTTGTIKMVHDATNKSFIYIEDLGRS